MIAVQKSRDIPKQEFYSLVQLEYLSYKVRELTYERELDKVRFSDICRMKKEKIDKYAERELMRSIFNDLDYRKKYLDLFFNEFGLPNFEYKDEQARKITGHWDRFHYFRAGQEVEIDGVKFNIKWNKPDNLELEILNLGRVDTIPYSKCKRNLKEILFKFL